MKNGESGGAFRGILVLLVLLVGIGGVAAYTFGYVVKPGYFGVRQIKFGPNQGYSKRGLKPGYHWSIPFYTTVHMVPEAVQTMHLNRNNSEFPNSPGALEVQTTDGSSVDVDLTILYRFFPEPELGEGNTESHGGPQDLFGTVGLAQQWYPYLEQIVVNEVKKALGRLSTSEFYNPVNREAEVLKAQRQLKRRLHPDGIGIDAVLLRRYTYRDQRIDNEIFEKNLQDQEERFNKSASRLATTRASLEEVAANLDAQIMTLKVEGENKARVIVSEAQLYEAEKVAVGDLKVSKARAEADRLRAEALGRGLGGGRYVASELAPVLQSLEGGIITNLDPYDFEEWLQRFGAGEE